MCGEKRSRTLPDPCDDAVLIRERVATGLEDDLFERRHPSSVCAAADARSTCKQSLWPSRNAGRSRDPDEVDSSLKTFFSQMSV